MRYADQEVDAAFAVCRRLARRHYENFPVASYLVPRDKRDALAAVYAFARCADDFADEPGAESAGMPDEARLRQLNGWRRKLLDCYVGCSDHPVFVALGDAVRRFQLSRENFENLLRAFELDVRVNRHPSFASLLAYCSCSANPVGRIVLELFGHREPELVGLSDSICTALQLTNFWQDIAIDHERGRVYLPLEDLSRFEYSLDDLAAGKVDDRWRRLLAFQVARTREMFDGGRPLPEKVTPSLRVQLRLTWLGGVRILDKIESAEYDVFRIRPTLRFRDILWLYLQARRGHLRASARVTQS